MEKDLIFLSGKFMDFELPKEKKYLLKYFDTDIQQAWIVYYLIFGDFKNFTDHTGIYCGKTYSHNLLKKLEKIQKAHQEAKTNLELEKLALIETGKFVVSEN